MTLRSLLKSPSVIGGAGLAGTGGAGVGGGQIYEEVNPTVDKQLSRQGYSYRPIEAPNEDKPQDRKFAWSGWGCITRLFPAVGVKYDDLSSNIAPSTVTSPSDSQPATSNASDGKFTTCAIMEMKPVTPSGENIETRFKNRIYLKSEVAVKGKDYGGIMGTGLSTFPQKQSDGDYMNHVELIYRLLELKKSDEGWVVNRGLGGDHLFAQSFNNHKFIVFPPLNQDGGFKGDKYRAFGDNSDFGRKVWAGVGEVDENEKSDGKDILGSISIYPNKEDEAEFWGSDGEFNMFGAGYTYSQIVYIKDKGWQRISKGHDLSSSLKEWYAPFKGKKIRWTNLDSRCYEGSSIRNKKITPAEEDLRSLCYWKK